MHNLATGLVARVRTQSERTLLALGLFLIVTFISRAGQIYDYKIVAKASSGNFTEFDHNPSINNAGKVAFIAERQGGQGVFVGDTSGSTPVQVDYSSGREYRSVSIN